MKQSSIRVVHRTRLGAAAEEARYARARAWAYVFACWHDKQKTPESSVTDWSEQDEKDKTEMEDLRG